MGRDEMGGVGGVSGTEAGGVGGVGGVSLVGKHMAALPERSIRLPTHEILQGWCCTEGGILSSKR